MGSVEIDRTRFPVVRMTIVGAPTTEQLRVALVDLDEVLGARSRFAIVVDLTHVGLWPACTREAALAWLASHHEELERCCVGIGAIAVSPFAVALVSTMTFLDPDSRGVRTLASDEAAAEWAEARLRAAETKAAKDVKSGERRAS